MQFAEGRDLAEAAPNVLNGVIMKLSKSRAWRRLRRSAFLQRIACWVTHCYIRFVYLTNRWSVEGGDWTCRLTSEGRTFICAFWHGRLLMMPLAWHGLAPFHMLISAHRDGRIIAGAMSYFGIGTIAGSTRRGGSLALREILKRLKEGGCVGITPDGPRGPAMTVSIGIVNIARLGRCAHSAGDLCDEPPAGAPDLGPLPSRFAVRTRRVSVWRAG